MCDKRDSPDNREAFWKEPLRLEKALMIFYGALCTLGGVVAVIWYATNNTCPTFMGFGESDWLQAALYALTFITGISSLVGVAAIKYRWRLPLEVFVIVATVFAIVVVYLWAVTGEDISGAGSSVVLAAAGWSALRGVSAAISPSGMGEDHGDGEEQ